MGRAHSLGRPKADAPKDSGHDSASHFLLSTAGKCHTPPHRPWSEPAATQGHSVPSSPGFELLGQHTLPPELALQSGETSPENEERHE